MKHKVSLTDLSAEIVLAVKEYTEDVSEGIEAEVEATAKKVLEDIKKGSPVATGGYKKGWRRKRETIRGGRVFHVVYQKSKPHLAHLLEFGHAKRGGGRVDGRPHIRPAYKEHVETMDKRIREIVRRGGP